MYTKDIIILGGGAAGIFAAILAKTKQPDLRITVLEKTHQLLTKVSLSGGGRCNVTNACFSPDLLIQNYPRGSKELLGPFHGFGPKETMDWFTSHGVELITEAEGRVFPKSNSSKSIVSCLTSQAEALGVDIQLNISINQITKPNDLFLISGENTWSSPTLLIATGSSPEGYSWAQSFGHTIEPPVPSLFPLAIVSPWFSNLSGTTIDYVQAHIIGTDIQQNGSLLITHTGFSGPCALKLSAWGARYLHDHSYQAELSINWLPNEPEEAIFHRLSSYKTTSPQSLLTSSSLSPLSKNLWKSFVNRFAELSSRTLGETSNQRLRILAHALHDDRYLISGRASHRGEFVTCGGVRRKEICWKTMESTLCPSLFFAGEILDVDGVTGGFNLQNAWTTGYIASKNSCIKRQNMG